MSYSTMETERQIERVSCPVWIIATLTFVATTSALVLVHPAEPSALFGRTIPRMEAVKSVLGIRMAQPAMSSGSWASTPHEVNFGLRSLTSGSQEAPASASASGTTAAGVVLGAVAATALSLMNRFRPKAQHASSTALHTAVLDPPTAPTSSGSVYNKGIVTPEEGMNLPFTMAELKDAIPKECFEKSLGWSLFYFARDWAIVALMYHYQPAFFGLGILGKVLWWNIVGFYGWCLFVVGHDCGHGTFSNYGWLNQILGHVCHAPLLVPFNGWRISHRAHHQYHNDVDRDHSWRPSVADAVDKLSGPIKALRFTPFILLVYPYYLLSNSHENGFSGCHFWPWNSLFKKEERLGIAMSALSVIGWLGVVAAATTKFGFSTVFQLYWIPYMIFVCWLDLVTLMQHTDKNALFFKGEAWTYLRGAMSTIDRTYRHLIDPFNLGYGRVIDHLHHHISDGHVVHHIFFTQIPHYRLMAATEAIKPILGKHYRYDGTPILKAFMDTLNECWFVDDIQSGVVTYKGQKEYKQHQAQLRMQGMA